jgi:hypothetical protein
LQQPKRRNPVTNRVECLNPEAHGVKTHVGGSAAAIACTQTGGRSTKMLSIAVPPRVTRKGNNIGRTSVMTNISPEALDWGKNSIKKNSPMAVASVIEVLSSNPALRDSYRDIVRPFVTLMHDEGYADQFGGNPLLPDPYDLGDGYAELNDQSKKIVESSPSNDFFEAVAAEAEITPQDAASAYGIIQGFLGDQDKARVWAVGCLRSEYLARKEEEAEVKKQIAELAKIFNDEVDDGTQLTKHGIPFEDGDGVQFTPTRKFNYDDAAPIPVPKDATENEAADIREANKERLNPDKYNAIIEKWVPKYRPLAEVEKILGEDANKYIEYASTTLKVS